MTQSPTQTPTALQHIELGVTGMTCSSCSSRVQRKLNRLDGVDASVNFSTETAAVDFDASTTTPQMLIDEVRKAGYDAFALNDGAESADGAGGAEGASSSERLDNARLEEAEKLKRTTIWAALVSLPVMLVSMIPSLQFTNWQWAAFAATTLVFFAAGSVFHRATWANLKHGAMTMDTLITLGTSAAYLWSVWALFFGNAGEPGMVMEMSIFPSHAGMDEIYLESVCVVITFLLLGRWFETRAKGQSAEALRELQDQIQALRNQLEELSGRVFEYEPAAVRASARRISELEAVQEPKQEPAPAPEPAPEPEPAPAPEPAQPEPKPATESAPAPKPGPSSDDTVVITRVRPARPTGAPSSDAIAGRIGTQPSARPARNPLSDLISEREAEKAEKFEAEPEPAVEARPEQRSGRRRRDERGETSVSVAELLARQGK